jgi:DNA-directed RNA polymerase
MTIAERVQWVESHTQEILAAASSPLYNRWWAGADKPFQFYAFCVEWARLQAWMQEGHAEEDFVSALPCSVDGTCNGLQHYGGLWACADTGAAVNLIPAALPSDIYTDVQRKVVAQLTHDAAEGDDTAAKWLASGLVSRKLCKRPVMTFPYGSKVFGFRSQIAEYLKHRGDNVQESKRLYAETQEIFTSPEGRAKGKPGDLLTGAVGYLASVIGAAIRGTVVKAALGMEWMQKGARLIAGEGGCVTWTVPATGFVVRQEYMEVKQRQVKTVLCGSVYRPVMNVPTDKPAKHRQANAIAPNVIHSLDAAALMTTVLAARQDGVSSFAMIHDSYGTVAGNCALLARAARQSFFKLYTDHAVVPHLHATLLGQMTPDAQAAFPQPPEQGTLDLSGVLASDFFFA